MGKGCLHHQHRCQQLGEGQQHRLGLRDENNKGIKRPRKRAEKNPEPPRPPAAQPPGGQEKKIVYRQVDEDQNICVDFYFLHPPTKPFPHYRKWTGFVCVALRRLFLTPSGESRGPVKAFSSFARMGRQFSAPEKPLNFFENKFRSPAIKHPFVPLSLRKGPINQT